MKLENDSRTEGFIKKHGRVYATELDTLPVVVPAVFKEIVVDSVNQRFDQEIYDREVASHAEEHSEEAIKALVKRKIDDFAEALRNPKND